MIEYDVNWFKIHHTTLKFRRRVGFYFNKFKFEIVIAIPFVSLLISFHVRNMGEINALIEKSIRHHFVNMAFNDDYRNKLVSKITDQNREGLSQELQKEYYSKCLEMGYAND